MKNIIELQAERKDAKAELKAAEKVMVALKNTVCEEQAREDYNYQSEKLASIDRQIDKVNLLNDGKPVNIFEIEKGHIFTVSPSTAKKSRGYITEEYVPLTDVEKKMPGVVVAQNRGMMFSSSRKISGDYVIPQLRDLNVIVVDEVSRKLYPVDTEEDRIFWKGEGEHSIKDVAADGQGQHWFCHADGRFADDLYMKPAKLMYGCKGMLEPGMARDVGKVVIDHWNIPRTITLGNTLLMNSSMIKGLGAYSSLEELIAHSESWGLTRLQKQWQSGDHKPAKKRIMGTQANAGNLALTYEEIEDLLKPEALDIWMSKFPKIAWMKNANINTCRGRALAARPSLMYKDVIMAQIDTKAGNTFRRIAQSKFKAEGQYLKLYFNKLAYSLIYVDGMDYNEAARKAAETGLHGEIRVNPAFAGMRHIKSEDGTTELIFDKETHVDGKGRYIEIAMVRYPHGAPSETIVVKAYLDPTVPEDVIVFPAPVADENGRIPVSMLFAFRLQGADFDGDAVTAYTEKKWVEAQKRNTGNPYMVIPVNTEGTEKDKTKVTDETWENFCKEKVSSLSNQVGLIATSLKYLLAQCASDLCNQPMDDIEQLILDQLVESIVDHACAMGDDIDEFKHGKANNSLVPFELQLVDGTRVLKAPYFNRYAKKYRTEEDFKKAVYNKDGTEKNPGCGILDDYAVAAENLMAKCKIQVVPEVAKATDGKNRWYYTVHPVQWEAKQVDLHITKGEGSIAVALPEMLEDILGIEHGTKFTAKDLFETLRRNHNAQIKDLLAVADDEETKVKAMTKVYESYMLAKVAIVAWAKTMKMAKSNEEITAEEAMKIFTVQMVQHGGKYRSPIDVLTRIGTFKTVNNVEYEKTLFDAQRVFNYFLDVCGDGLLMLGVEEPNFPEVSEKTFKAANVTAPDIEEAKAKAAKEFALIDRLVGMLPFGATQVIEEIDSTYNPVDGDTCCADEDDYDISVLDDGCMSYSVYDN